MLRTLRPTAYPLLAAAIALAATVADAAEVRDRAGMFSAKAVQKAESELSRVEKQSGVPIVIETIDAIPDLPADATSKVKSRAINALAEKRVRDSGDQGIYILLSKKDRVLSNVLIRERLTGALPEATRLKIRDSFVEPFKAGDYDGGLIAAASAIDSALPDSPVAARRGENARRLVPVGGPAAAGRQANGGQQQFGLGTLFLIGGGILGALFLVRLLSGGLGNRGGYPQGMPGPGQGQAPGMGGPGYGPGMGGQGYGAPGYGGRGGGFFSGMLGGLGGAVAGNWLYDQFSGRHSQGQHNDASGYTPMGGDNYGGGDGIVGGNDDGGQGGSWGDSGGGDWGGGGGDWGGGGGDDGGSW